MKKSKIKRAVLAASVIVLAIGCSIGGTLAWLVDTDGPVENTFTYGDVNIDLDETTGDEYKIVPGVDIDKDPNVTVLAGSEDCWLFVKIEEDAWNDALTYELGEGWTLLPGVDKVYYREVSNSTNAQDFQILKDDTVKVSDALTKDEVDSLLADPDTANPKLTFTAYAIQKAKNTDEEFTATAAWTAINTPATTTTTNP